MARDGYLLLPIDAIIYLLYQGYSEETAGLMAIIVTVAMAVASAGMIIGCLFLSGIGMKFSYILINLSGGQLWLALIYTTIEVRGEQCDTPSCAGSVSPGLWARWP